MTLKYIYIELYCNIRAIISCLLHKAGHDNHLYSLLSIDASAVQLQLYSGKVSSTG